MTHLFGLRNNNCQLINRNMNFNNLKTENGMYSYMDFEDSINNIFNNGLPYGIESGLNNLDDMMRLDKGRLVTVTGIPQSGKKLKSQMS